MSPGTNLDRNGGRNFAISVPHLVNNATYQESYSVFSVYAKQAAAFGAIVNYGSQPITPHAVQASSDTPLNLTRRNQDCE